MYIEDSYIERALIHARRVAEFHSELPPLYSQKTPDTLILICRQYLQKNIEIFGLTIAEVRGVRAYYEALDDLYNVYVVENQDPLWRDFAACKELFHVVLDDPETEHCRTVELYKHVVELLETFVPIDGAPSPTAISEFLAEVAAMEFLFPFADRERIVSGGNEVDCAVVANQYDLPEALVGRYLSESYMESLRKFKDCK